MNSSHLQQLINDKEAELSKIRSLAANATLQREHEVREEMRRVVADMEKEVEQVHQNMKDITQQVEKEADARILHAMKEMELYLERRQKEIHEELSLQMEKSWQQREDSLQHDFKKLLESELDQQHKSIVSHYEAIIYTKDHNMNLMEEDMKQQLAKVNDQHQSELDAIMKKIWKEAHDQYTNALDVELSRSLTSTEAKCKEVLDENQDLRRLLDEKESIIKDNLRDMKEMEDTFRDVAQEVTRSHNKELADISDKASTFVKDNDRMQRHMKEVRSENERLTEEVNHCKMIIRSLEVKYNDQKRIVDTVDTSQSEFTSRINELKACNELLERQMMDLTSENKALVAEKEKQRILIGDLSSENEKQSTTIGELRQTSERNATKCTSLEQSLAESREQITSLEQERRVHTVQTNHLIETKERHHSELINVYEQKLATSKDEAAAAIKSAQNDMNALSSECNNLRSRILQLQRDNFRLEHELMDAQQRKQRQGNHIDDTNAKIEGANHEAEKLREENKALKEVINMMRNEMESAVSEDSRAEATDEKALMERQLSLCRSYLDLLLDSSNKRLTKYDELSFLRTKNRELLSIIDKLRHEGLGHNQSSQHHGTPSVHEQQLISQLEEASEEIDTLLQERDQLMKLSNELKFELHQALSTNEGQKRSSTRSLNEGQQQSRLEPQEDEAAGHILDAILNDFSAASCDGESHEESEVACIGMKPPTGNTTSVSNCSPRIKLYLHLVSSSTFAYVYLADISPHNCVRSSYS